MCVWTEIIFWNKHFDSPTRHRPPVIGAYQLNAVTWHPTSIFARVFPSRRTFFVSASSTMKIPGEVFLPAHSGTIQRKTRDPISMGSEWAPRLQLLYNHAISTSWAGYRAQTNVCPHLVASRPACNHVHWTRFTPKKQLDRWHASVKLQYLLDTLDSLLGLPCER